MKNIMIGGDSRMVYACESLNKLGKNFELYNIVNKSDLTAAEYINKIKNAKIIVLPVPLTYNNYLIQGCSNLTISDIKDNIQSGSVLFGMSYDMIGIDKGITCVNYKNDENYLLDMAYLTAEGAIGNILTSYKKQLKGSSVVIIGYGRIAKALIDILKHWSCDVTVILRNMKKFDTSQHSFASATTFDKLDSVLSTADIVLNTVPDTVIDNSMLESLSKKTYLVELASSPGGFDFSYALKCNLCAVRLPGLPGKCAPASAGRAVADVINRYI